MKGKQKSEFGDTPGHAFRGNRISDKATVVSSLEFGDDPGHDFHGNQYIVVGSKEHPVHVSSAVEAAEFIGEGKYVQLPPNQVSILLDKLAHDAQEAQRLGEKAPTYDLCKISVADTNLFCVDSKGIPRIDMPQLATANPVPGSPADALPRNDRGWVDISGAFLDKLEAEGHTVSNVTVRADQLKATQNELNGAKVGGIMDALEAGKNIPGSVWASNDNYVLDGHHRWAAEVGLDYQDQHLGDVTMPITRVDLPISVLLDSAKQFAKEMGVPQAGVSASAQFGDVSGHAFHGNQWVEGTGDEASFYDELKTWTDQFPKGTAFRAMHKGDVERVQRTGTLDSSAGEVFVSTDPTYSRAYLTKGEVMVALNIPKGATPVTGGEKLQVYSFPSLPASSIVGIFDPKNAPWAEGKPYEYYETPNEMAEREKLTAVVSALEFGDVSGHEFHGNQWTGNVGNVETLRGLAKKAQQTGTLDTFKTIHEAALGHGEIGSVNDDLDLDTVTERQVQMAHKQIYEASQRALTKAGAPETIEVFRKGRGQHDTGVVSVSTRKLDTFTEPQKYTISRSDVLTYGEGLQRGNFKEDELQVEADKLRAAVTSSLAIEFGDSEGHAFHGNQYTKVDAGDKEHWDKVHAQEDADMKYAQQGATLHAALEDWTHNGESARAIRHDAEDILNGHGTPSDRPGVDRWGQKLDPEGLHRYASGIMEAASLSPPTKIPLYRGDSVSMTQDEAEKYYKGLDGITFPLASFSETPKVADRFAEWNRERDTDNDDTTKNLPATMINYTIDTGAHAVSTEADAGSFWEDEKEHIVTGDYKIDSVLVGVEPDYYERTLMPGTSTPRAEIVAHPVLNIHLVPA
jgi:hypothetical protein